MVHHGVSEVVEGRLEHETGGRIAGEGELLRQAGAHAGKGEYERSKIKR